MKRRTFMETTAAVSAAATILPATASAKKSKFVSKKDKVKVGIVGCGTQMMRMVFEWMRNDDVEIIAVCDCNKDSQDYPEWGRWGLRNRISRELEDPTWGENDTGCRCGRDVAKEVIEKFYMKKFNKSKWKNLGVYEDFRDMLEKEKKMDGVWIMTPEHTHAVYAIWAMRKGKHVIMHKPIGNTVEEARMVAKVAQETGVATHMYCTSDKQTTPLIKEWIQAGAIGQVREVHNWSNRPVWPQGMIEYPKDTPPVPKGFNWDLWLGPCEERPFHPAYTHTNFRGWYDFGTGPLGDMGHYSGFPIWNILGLTVPTSVEATRSELCLINETGQATKMLEPHVAFPQASTVHWEFDNRGEGNKIDMYWYDGGIRPPKPLELEGRQMPKEGLLFVGDKGKLFAQFSGGSPRLIPESDMQKFSENRPPKTLPRPEDELVQWVKRCRGEQVDGPTFETILPTTETLLLGTVGLRVSDKLYWDAENMLFTNNEEANKYLKRTYRPGWEIA